MSSADHQPDAHLQALRDLLSQPTSRRTVAVGRSYDPRKPASRAVSRRGDQPPSNGTDTQK
jgi:hypothetical protein